MEETVERIVSAAWRRGGGGRAQSCLFVRGLLSPCSSIAPDTTGPHLALLGAARASGCDKQPYGGHGECAAFRGGAGQVERAAGPVCPSCPQAYAAMQSAIHRRGRSFRF